MRRGGQDAAGRGGERTREGKGMEGTRCMYL